MPRMRTVIGWAVVIFIGWWIISNPQGAAATMTNLLDGLKGVGTGLATFFGSLGH